MKIGMKRVLDSNSETFVTDFGIKLRQKAFNKYIQPVMTKTVPKKMVVEHYPNLEPGKPYIFASNHWFMEDFMIALATLDRCAFTLFGSTDQIEHQISSFFVWLTGMIYVDRVDREKRHDATAKMTRLLNSGMSVLIYPEGAYNNTDNLLCEQMYASPYVLNKATGAQVVPIAVYTLPELDTIYGNFGEPMDFDGMERAEAMELFRDIIATMHYEHIKKYGGLLTRAELESKGDYRLDFMSQRRAEYLKTKWSKDVWDEELLTYHDKSIVDPKTVREELRRAKITPQNAHILAPILARHEEDVKYDFKRFMKETWDK